MSFSGNAFKAKSTNYKPKCFYLINEIKGKNPNVWTRLYEKFKSLKPEDSYEFYQILLKEYKQLEDNNWKDVGEVKEEKKEDFNVVQYINKEKAKEEKKPIKKEAKKEVKQEKKAVKKVAKEEKKPAKKKVAKKKVAKKKVAKKKVAKKKVAKKKVAKKKVAKKKVAKKKVAKKKTAKKKK